MEEKEILSVLASEDNHVKVLLMQNLVKNTVNNFPADILTAIKALCENKDVAVRFWAKKLYSTCLPAEEVPPVQTSGNEDLPTEVLFQKLKAAQSHFVANEVLTKIFDKRDSSVFKPLIEYLSLCSDCIVISFLVKNLCIYYPNEATLAVVLPYLKHKDDRVIANCVEGLEFIPAPKATVLINQMLTHENHRVKANAAKALANRDPATTTKVIRFMLNSIEKPHFIIAACYAVKQIKSEEFLPDMVKLLSNPVISESALDAIVGIGNRTAQGYLEALLAETEDKELKDKIEIGISSIKINLNLQKVGDTVSNAIKDSQNYGKAIFAKIKEKVETQLGGTEDKHRVSEKFETSKRTAKIWGKAIINKIKESSSGLTSSNRSSLTLAKFAVLFAAFLSVVVFLSSSKMSSKQAGTEILQITAANDGFRKNIRFLSTSSNTISEVCSIIVSFDPYLKTIEKFHAYEFRGQSIYEWLRSGTEADEKVASFRSTVDKVITFIEGSIERAVKLQTFGDKLGQPFQDLENGIAALERNEYSWVEVDKTVQSAKSILALNIQFKEEIEILRLKLVETKQYLDDLAASPILEELKSVTLIGRVASGVVFALTKIIELLDTAQVKLESLKDFFTKEVLVLVEIAQTTRGIERIPD